MDTNLPYAKPITALNSPTMASSYRNTEGRIRCTQLPPSPVEPHHSQRCEQCQRPAASSTQQQVEREAVRLWFRQPCTAC